jgi:hypothetical protein
MMGHHMVFSTQTARSSIMSGFWVVGGEYRDTQFKNFADGHDEERFGPYGSYAEAEVEWKRRSWAAVDNCYVRYRIVEEAKA